MRGRERQLLDLHAKARVLALEVGEQLGGHLALAAHGPEMEDTAVIARAACGQKQGTPYGEDRMVSPNHPSHPPVKPARCRPVRIAWCLRIVFQTISAR